MRLQVNNKGTLVFKRETTLEHASYL